METELRRGIVELAVLSVLQHGEAGVVTMIIFPVGSVLGFAAGVIATIQLAMGHFERHHGRWMAVASLGLLAIHFFFALGIAVFA